MTYNLSAGSAPPFAAADTRALTLAARYRHRPRVSARRAQRSSSSLARRRQGVIDLRRRVCTVSVATMEIVDSMAQLENVTS